MHAGTTTNRDAFKGWELPKKRPSLGVAMVGDQYHVLIPSSMTAPCHGKQVCFHTRSLFTTVGTLERKLIEAFTHAH